MARADKRKKVKILQGNTMLGRDEGGRKLDIGFIVPSWEEGLLPFRDLYWPIIDLYSSILIIMKFYIVLFDKMYFLFNHLCCFRDQLSLSATSHLCHLPYAWPGH